MTLFLLGCAWGLVRPSPCESNPDLQCYRRLANRTLGWAAALSDEKSASTQEKLSLDQRVEQALVAEIDHSLSPDTAAMLERVVLAIRNAERHISRGERTVQGYTPADVEKYYAAWKQRPDAVPADLVALHHAYAVFQIRDGQGGKALAVLREAALPLAGSDPLSLLRVRDALADAYAQSGQFFQRDQQRCAALQVAAAGYGQTDVRIWTLKTSEEPAPTAQDRPGCVLRTARAKPTWTARSLDPAVKAAYRELLLHFIEDRSTDGALKAVERRAWIDRLWPTVRDLASVRQERSLKPVAAHRVAAALSRGGDSERAFEILRDHWNPDDDQVSTVIEQECALGRLLLAAGSYRAAQQKLRYCLDHQPQIERQDPFLRQELGLALLREPDATVAQLREAATIFQAVKEKALDLRRRFAPDAQVWFFNNAVKESFFGDLWTFLLLHRDLGEAELEMLLDKMDSLRAQGWRDEARGQAQERPERIVLDRLRERLGPQGALIEYLQLDERTLLIVAVTRERFKVVRQEVRALDGKIKTIHDLLASDQVEEIPSAQLTSLSELLLGQVRDLLPGKTRLWVIPDRTLAMIPFDLLTAAKPDGTAYEPLLDHHEVRFVNAAAPLTVAHADDAAGAASDRQSLLVGNLTYTSSAALPCTKDEVRAIAKLAGPQATLLDLDRAEARTVRAQMKTAHFLHFATHGDVNLDPAERLDDPAGDQPRLVLSGGQSLNATEVEKQGPLAARLTVLSACESGIGSYQLGEGLLGLGRAFQRAGSRQVIASLWKIDDGATARLMEEFYSNLWDKRQAPLTALTNARRSMSKGKLPAPVQCTDQRNPRGERHPGAEAPSARSSTKTKAPRFWAGFILLSRD